MFTRKLLLQDIENESIFLFGARQTGKSTLVKEKFPQARYYDLLKSDVFERLFRAPWLFREELDLCLPNELVIVDEIQKIPQLLNEVHWLIHNRQLRFLLCGSSARKLKRCGANLLGGRAISERLHPLVSAEVPDFDFIKAVNHGLLPQHYLSFNPRKKLQAYIGNYLQEEIREEAQLRNLRTFSHFLDIAALTNGEIVNFTNIASDCGVSSPTVKDYFSILEETMFGYFVPAYTKTVKRRLIQAPKFYLFDVGIANYLTKRKSLLPGSLDFGKAFEHLIIHELTAYQSYSFSEETLSYWRTANGYEVDVVLGDAQVAIEIKSCNEVQSRHLKGLKAFSEEYPKARLIVVSLDPNPRRMNDIEIYPVTDFLKKLWNNEIIPLK
jgi:predicted AAA+ superfamily ATPase